jgi:two-component system, LytTR family, sensor kinase
VICPAILLLLAIAPTNDSSIIERCFNFGVGAALAALLMILALRSTGEHRIARLGFAGCALTFTLAACVAVVALGFGQSPKSPVVVLALDLAFCAAAAWPITILALWSDGDYSSNWRRQLGRLVIAMAWLSAVGLSFVHVTHLFPQQRSSFSGINSPLDNLYLTAYNAFFFLWLGAVVFLPGRLQGRLSWVSVTALLAGVSLASARCLEEHSANFPPPLHSGLLFCKPFTILLIVAGGLFGFSRFRFTDIFAQKGLRILLGALLSLACSFLAPDLFGSLLRENEQSRGLAVLGFALLVWIAIVSYAKITMLSDWLVDRQIFRQADYQRVLKSFRETIASQSEPINIFNIGKALARDTLRIADATVRPGDGAELPAASGHDSTGNRECIFPIQKGEEPAEFCLVILPGHCRHTLFSAEIDFLREICLAIGRRLQAIEREKEKIERAGREAQLVKQLVEAELRALRAQINPHFLFNSLNSVAALITAEPQAAEEMIIRLAKIFRHVLTYHDRPFSSVKEEISFLETYLEIEKVRFGERLQVKFDVHESVTQLSVPTLILQPLVENAIKHGLGPKVGVNELTVRARKQIDYLELSVEDNGVGANSPKKSSEHKSRGLGLRNVEERLQTVYRGHARFSFESQPRTGTRAQILIPIPALHEKTALAAD